MDDIRHLLDDNLTAALLRLRHLGGAVAVEDLPGAIRDNSRLANEADSRAMCWYPMCAALKVLRSAVWSYCGLWRERGIVLTSTTLQTPWAFNNSRNWSIGRVEWPIVYKTGRFNANGIGRPLLARAGKREQAGALLQGLQLMLEYRTLRVACPRARPSQPRWADAPLVPAPALQSPAS
jgi:hypothetical protein